MALARREFLKLLSASGLAVTAPLASFKAAAQAAPDRFWVFFSASGGWDVTSLMDPKGNIDSTGKGVVNQYNRNDIKTSGAFQYAPWAIADDPGTYDRFFQNYGSELTVINGIDMQTNAHPVGQSKIWSGEGSKSFPCMAALIAACTAPNLPLSFLSNGYYDGTAGVIPKTRANNVNALFGLALPNRLSTSNTTTYFHPDVDAMLKDVENQRLQDLIAGESLPERRAQQSQLFTVRQSAKDIERLIDRLPDPISNDRLERQIQIACSVFSAGIGISANIEHGGFDTHDDNDQRTFARMNQLLLGVEFLMQEAERQGIRDKLTVVIGSDFGRRPFYNDDAGKDHWPIGSAMLLGAGVTGNRVVGATNDGLEARKINKSTLALNDNGSLLTAEDLNYTIRSAAGIADNPIAQAFPVSGANLNLIS